MIAALSFTLTSCGDDDDEPSSSAEIVGTWENITSRKSGVFNICRFQSNGTYVEYQCEAGFDYTEIFSGYWYRSGKNLIIQNEFITIESTILKLTENEMKASTLGVVQEFKRLPDSSFN